MIQTGRSKKAKNRRSAKVDGPKGQNWTVISNQSRRSFEVFSNESGLSSRTKVDGASKYS